MQRSKIKPFITTIIMIALLLFGCQRDKKTVINSMQKYVIDKITLGTFTVNKEKPFGTPGLDGVYWMTMGKGSLAIDDAGRVYVLNGTRIQIYGQNGSLKSEISIRDLHLSDRAKSLEVSGDGSRLYVRAGNDTDATYYIIGNNGALIGEKADQGYLKRTCRDIFIGEKYSSDKNAVEKVGLYALDRNLDMIKDLKDFYLKDVPLNERPSGFFDADLNFYFMRFWPDVTKLSSTGKLIWKKQVAFKGENWRLIGIDKDANLYALVVTGGGNSIVKMNKELDVLASIALEGLAKNLENVGSIQSDGSEVQNFLVTCDGAIFFIPNNADSVNPAFEYAFKEYRARGEYYIYKIDQIK